MEINYIEEKEELEIKLRFSKQDLDCLKHDLPGIEGIIDWYRLGPSSMKIESCKKRMKNQWIDKLRESGQAIPPDDASLLQAIKAHPDYKDREAREAREAEANLDVR